MAALDTAGGKAADPQGPLVTGAKASETAYARNKNAWDN